MTTKHTGACQCGAVKFEAEGTPQFVCNCHCASCRKATGAAFSTWVGFKAENVRWPSKAPAVHASSPGVQRGFCQECGTPLTFASEKWPGDTHFLVGVFDDPAQFNPQKNAFTEDALPWALSRGDA